MEVTASILIDLSALSRVLDEQLGQYFLPEVEGFYLPFQLDPVMLTGRAYYVELDHTFVKKVETLDDITGDVRDQNGKTVLYFKQKFGLKTTPHPYRPRSVKLIQACVDHLLHSHGVWSGTPEKQRQWNKPATYNLRGVIRDFVDPQYLVSPLDALNHPELAQKSDQLLEMIEDHLLDFRTQVIDFLGKNRWVMHFQKLKHGTLTIEKGIDWRVMIFMQERGYWDAP